MFGLKLANEEWAAVIAVAYLFGRIAYAVGRVLWWYATDSKRVVVVHILLSLVTGAAVAAMSVSLVLILADLQPGFGRTVICVGAGVAGFILGVIFDMILDIRLYRVSDWLLSFRVPGYREQLLHGDAAVRLAAAEQLGTLGAYAIPARPELLATFKDESTDVRSAAVHAVLNSIPDPPPEDDTETVKAARSALMDADIRVRVPATAILIVFKAATPEEILPTLREAATYADDITAGTATVVLERMGPSAEPAIPELRKAVLEREPPNLTAIGALGKIGAPAVPVLIEILERGNNLSKWYCAEMLAEMGEAARPAMPALLKATQDPDVGTSGAAKRAIEKLGDRARAKPN